MMRIAAPLAILLALGACAPEPPPEPPLPLPPPPPPQMRAANRGAALPARPQPAPEAEAPPPGPAAAPVAAAVAPASPPPVWRVRRDGTLACADQATLRLLRERQDLAPRLVAEARAAGGCRTTFRINEWALDGSDGELVRLRLVNGAPLMLWFARGDVAQP